MIHTQLGWMKTAPVSKGNRLLINTIVEESAVSVTEKLCSGKNNTPAVHF